VRPSRGEVWYAELSPTRDHEQAGFRPVLVVSADELNRAPGELAVIVPLTTSFRYAGFSVSIRPPEGGLRAPSYALCDQIRSVSSRRLSRRIGRVSTLVLEEIVTTLSLLLAIPPA
jgi:mRNA interferase MazF